MIKIVKNKTILLINKIMIKMEEYHHHFKIMITIYFLKELGKQMMNL